MTTKEKLEVLEDFLNSFEKEFPDHDDYDIDDDKMDEKYRYDLYLKHLNEKGVMELKRMCFYTESPILTENLYGVLYKEKQQPGDQDIISFKLYDEE